MVAESEKQLVHCVTVAYGWYGITLYAESGHISTDDAKDLGACAMLNIGALEVE